MHRLGLVAVTLLLAAALPGCARDPIDWDENLSLQPVLAAGVAPSFDARGRLVSSPTTGPGITPPVFPGQCAGSLRLAHDSARGWFAVWWSSRADSTAEVLVARSIDGRTWSRPLLVDSTDVGRIGCRRPPPSIAADSRNVHVAYAMTAREGPGIFASHSMDRETMFHSPVAVVYGERPGETAIAAQGDLVAIAYEDPNSDPPRIGVALSRTMGHTFGWRGLVSPTTTAARSPGLALGAGRIAVTWARSDPGATTRIVRVGSLP